MNEWEQSVLSTDGWPHFLCREETLFIFLYIYICENN
jgi:hypothetical protein